MSKIWFTSDSHFGHRNIMEYSNRPFLTIDDHDKQLIKNWNDCVKPSDTIYHLGDVSFKFAYGNVLRGNIIHIRGNHDKGKFKYASVMHDVLQLKLNDTLFWLSHYPHLSWPKIKYGSKHFYGHVHGNITTTHNSLDVGVDNIAKLLGGNAQDYRPVNLKEALDMMSNFS